MQPLGRYLKSEREKRGIHLEEIASSTKIHIQNLSLMEEDRWKELPQEPFIRGFISAYARYVGLNNKETLKLFSEYQASLNNKVPPENLDSISSPPPPEVTPAQQVAETKEKPANSLSQIKLTKGSSLRLGLLVLLLVLLLSVFLTKENKKEAAQDVAITPPPQANLSPENVAPTSPTPVAPTEGAPAVPQDQAPAAALPSPSESASAPTQTTLAQIALQAVPPAPPSQASAPVAVAQPEPVAPAPPSPQAEAPKPEPVPTATSQISGHEIVVQTKYKSWMKVVIDNEPPQESYLEPETKMTFRSKEKIKLVLGNSTGASVSHNGEETKGKKFAGTIRYYIFPKGSRFPQDKPKNKEKESEDGSTEGQEPIATTPEESPTN